MSKVSVKPNFQDVFTGVAASTLNVALGISTMLVAAPTVLPKLAEVFSQFAHPEPAKILASGVFIAVSAILNGLLSGKTMQLVTLGSAAKNGRIEVEGGTPAPQPPVLVS